VERRSDVGRGEINAKQNNNKNNFASLTQHLDILCNANQPDALFLSIIYFVTQPLHVSGIFIAHHQEVFTVYEQQLVRVIRLGEWLLPFT
jgi:hypothetical protein